MNGLTCRWSCRAALVGRPAVPPDDARTGPLLTRILRARGLDPASPAAAAFLDPKLAQLHDPSLIPDLDRAAARLLDALRAGETIAIYGDYDVDGITATAILYHTLIAICPDAKTADRIICYVPHRIDEGYGLNSDAIAELARRGARVIVSVDCGVGAFEPAARARAEGVDLIITDHHNAPAPDAGLPDAYAIVHPRRPGAPGPDYPFADLSGAGVAYKLAWRLATMHERSPRLSPDLRTLLIDLLAFAALGTIADVVPLVGENRVIARFGLGRIQHSPFTGLCALVAASGLDGGAAGVDAMDVGFKLAPRLNAAGRMGHAKDAVELFTTADQAQAAAIASGLTTQNNQRRQVEKAIFVQACDLAEAAGMTAPDRRAIVLAHDDWHAGVVGIVCSRLVERYSRPVILMQRREGVCHGSARSIDGYNLHAGLVSCAEHLEKFGGHDMAAGLHLADARLPAFTDAFTAHANRLITEEMLRPLLRFDCESDLDELTPDAVHALNGLAPFGRENPRVSVLLRALRIAGPPQTFGAGAKHLGLTLRSGGASVLVRAIAWNRADHAPRLAAGMTIDAVLRPRLNTFNGRTTVEPEIEDIRLHS